MPESACAGNGNEGAVHKDQITSDLGLTQLTKHAILSYPLPDQQTGEQFAAFT